MYITALIRLLDTTDNQDTRRRAVWNLGQIGTGNEGAIAALIRLLDTTDDENTSWLAATSLEKIDHCQSLIIRSFAKLYIPSENKWFWSVIENDAISQLKLTFIQ